MTFEELNKANLEIKTLPLGKKNYAEVAERVTAFRKLYPEGQILTRLVKYEDRIVIFSATVTDGERVLATGTAKEVEGSSNINRTSAIENCETSAVGRALGFLGLTGGGSIASYEEVENAKLQQDGMKLASTKEKDGMMATIKAKAKVAGITPDELLAIVLEYVEFDRDKQPDGITVEQYGKAMNYLNAQGNKSDKDSH